MRLKLERRNGDHLGTRALKGTSGTEFGVGGNMSTSGHKETC